MKRKFLAIVTFLCLLLSLMPVTAFAAEGSSLPFSDVHEGDWFYDAAAYAYGHNIIEGVDETTFAPNSPVNRSMIIEILYRLENEPEVKATMFTDVGNEWYADAANWGGANKIINGYSDGRFNPDGEVTRADLAVFMYNYAKARGCDMTAAADLSRFDDQDDIPVYALNAMRWAVAEGLLQGVSGTLLQPNGGVLRAQLAAVIMRFEEGSNVGKPIGGSDDGGPDDGGGPDMGGPDMGGGPPNGGGGGGEALPAEREGSKGMANLDADPQGFVCIVTEDEDVYWQAGVDSYEKLLADNDISGRYVKLEMVPDNDKEHMYLYPELDWKLLVYEEEKPAWMDAGIEAAAEKAFQEWKDEVYSLFDYEAYRELTVEDTTSASPGDGYQPTTEELKAFRELVTVKNSLSTYIKSSVTDTLTAAFGKTMAEDIWNFLNDGAGKQAENAANVGSLLRSLGTSNVGAVQKDFYGAVVGHYFPGITQWNYYSGDIEGYPYESAYYLWANGLCISQDSDKLWRLHTADGGYVCASIPNDEVSTSKAFAAVVGQDGTVYWETGLDDVDSVRARFELDPEGDYVDVRIRPVIDYDRADLALPDGNNPDVTKYFAYFESAAVWTLYVEDDAGQWVLPEEAAPAWFDQGMEDAAMSAFQEWKAVTVDAFHLAEAGVTFTDETLKTAEPTEEDLALLKEWAVIWNVLKANGNPTEEIKSSGSNSVGSTVWAQADEYFLSTWRTKHSDCPGAVVSNGYKAAFGAPTDAANNYLADSVSDAMEALTGMYFTGAGDWTWIGYEGDADGYPYECVATLIARNLVPCTDGAKWYLCSGENADIVYEITVAELLGE